VACQQNFGQKRSLTSVYDHINRIADAQVATWEEKHAASMNDEENDTSSDVSQEEAPSPVLKDYSFIIGDGDPQLQGLRMKSDHPERYHHMVNIIPGQFHYMMDDFKANNRLFKEILHCLLGPIYGGDLKRMRINFTKFSDPTIPEKQLSSLLLAIHVHIIRSMVCAGKSAFSIVDMHD
jgi:hypothetical protein